MEEQNVLIHCAIQNNCTLTPLILIFSSNVLKTVAKSDFTYSFILKFEGDDWIHFHWHSDALNYQAVRIKWKDSRASVWRC